MKRTYQLINQKPYCCVAACLQMILERANIDGIRSQETILSNFEKTDLNGDGNKRFAVIKDLNIQFFDKYNYPLMENYITCNFVLKYDKHLYKLIKDFNKSDDDFMLFANAILVSNDIEAVKGTFNKDDDDLKVKHCFLVSEIIDENNIFLICPDTEKNGGTRIIKTTAKRIHDAFEYQEDKSSLGYSIIKRKK